MQILNENKDRFIDKNPNLTPEQKQQIKELLKKYPYLESKAGDWQKSDTWTWDDFQKLFNLVTQSKTHIKKRAGIEGLKEGTDYVLLYDKNGVTAYRPLTHLGSYVIASNRVGPAVWTEIPGWYSDPNPSQDYTQSSENPKLWSGAKWCISMKHTSHYWDDYTRGGRIAFAFVMSEDESKVPTKKLAFTLHGADEDSPNRVSLEIYDAPDHGNSYLASEVKNGEASYPDLVNCYRALLKTVFATGRDYFDQLVNSKALLPTVKDGYYTVPDPKAVSLDRLYDGTENFDVKIDIWKGPMRIVGEDRLKHCPRRIWGNLVIDHVNSLVGCPDEVRGSLTIKNSKLETLEGIPQNVKGDIIFQDCEVHSFKGLPAIVKRNLEAKYCKVSSLEGIDRVVGRLSVDYNFLSDLKGPSKLGELSAMHNRLTTLEGMPEVDGFCDVSYNPDLESLDGLNITDRGFVLHKKTGIH